MGGELFRPVAPMAIWREGSQVVFMPCRAVLLYEFILCAQPCVLLALAITTGLATGLANASIHSPCTSADQ